MGCLQNDSKTTKICSQHFLNWREFFGYLLTRSGGQFIVEQWRNCLLFPLTIEKNSVTFLKNCKQKPIHCYISLYLHLVQKKESKLSDLGFLTVFFVNLVDFKTIILNKNSMWYSFFAQMNTTYTIFDAILKKLVNSLTNKIFHLMR